MINVSVLGSISASVSGSGPIAVSVYGSTQSLDGSIGPLTPVGSGNSVASGGSLASSSFALSPEKPTEMIWLSTRLETGSFSFSVKTSTGYAAVMWWDGTVTTGGTGNAGSYLTLSKTIPTSGSYARSAPKSVYVWAVSSAGSLIQSGAITGFAASSRKVTALNVSDCESLASLSCDTNGMEFLGVSRCPALTSLLCFGNRIRSLDITTCPALVALYCQNNLIEFLDVSKCTKLIVLQCNSNLIPSLDIQYTPDLVSLFCNNNLISSLSFTVAKKVTSLNCSNNKITTIRAPGVSFASPYGANLENNFLPASGLNQFYSDLAVSASPSEPVAIYVAGNIGAFADNPSIATGKGYVVYG